jgi:Tol biopolymer transport system component/DNA-binding winged helix-turn-helix (wHTH) protein
MDDARASAAEPVLRRRFFLDQFTVDPLAGEVRGSAGREQLDPKVMAVLVVLAERAGSVVRREELLAKVWPGMVVTDDVLSRCIYQLRRHLSQAGGNDRCRRLLETLPKRGYRLNCAAPAPAVPPSVSIRGERLDAPGSPEAWRAISARPVPVGPRRSARLLIVAASLLVAVGASVVVLNRLDYFWRNPLADARFTRLTDFEGAEQDAAISRDGRFVAFLSDRDGVIDAWIKEVDVGELRNLTRGRGGELRNPAVRTVGFSSDGSDVTLWTRVAESSAGAAPIRLWAVPSTGGPLRKYLEGVAEVAWSPDGTRMAYHPAESGDPLFVTGPNEKVGRQIFIAPPGLHCHYPLWSPDGVFIYFVYGSVPDAMDVWRIAPAGGEPERITFHDSRVAHPVLLDARTLLYLATDEDGSGPWLYAMNVERRVAHRIDLGLQQYTSLSTSDDGRRLAATVTTQRTSLWRVPVLRDRIAGPSDASQIELPTLGGRSPRLGPGYVLYRSPSAGTEGLWKLARADSTVIELWNGRQGRVVSALAIEPNGDRVAFTVAAGNRAQLYVMNGDGRAAVRLAEDLDVRGNPAWSPDGQWIAIAADRGGGAQLFRIPSAGGPPVPTVDKYSIDPAWSPDGTFLVYRGTEAGPTFPVLAATIDGDPHAVPNLILPRGGRVAFLPGRQELVVLKGEIERKNFWLIDLASGEERQLTDFGTEFVIDDFDVSADGEIVFDRVREESDVVVIEVAGR